MSHESNYETLGSFTCTPNNFVYKRNRTIPTFSRNGSNEPNNDEKIFKESYGSKSLQKATEECVKEGRMIVNRMGQQRVDPKCILEKYKE